MADGEHSGVTREGVVGNDIAYDNLVGGEESFWEAMRVERLACEGCAQRLPVNLLDR